jgi:hypothetical protein
MKRIASLVGLALALLLCDGTQRLPAGTQIVLAAAPQKEGSSVQQENVEESRSPEEKFARRFPQPAKVGDLIGLAVLDDGDSTIGFVKDIVRSPAGKIELVVPYARWFGWIGNGGIVENWRRPVAVPIEKVAMLGKQIAALDMPREDFDKAPDFIAAQATPIGREETILVALTRR